MAKYNIGQQVRLWKPGHAEHGLKAKIKEIITIQEYGGPEYRGPHAYRPEDGWRDENGEWWVGGPLPDAMVVSEEEYQKLRNENRFWRP